MKTTLTLILLTYSFWSIAQFDKQVFIQLDPEIQFTDCEFSDLDSDGDFDMILIVRNGVHQIYENINGSYTLKETEIGTEFNDQYANSHASIADFNKDGLPDIAIISYSDENHKVYRNKSNFEFELDSENPILNDKKTYTYSYGSEWVDFDSDGDMDFFLSHGNRYSSNGINTGNEDLLYVNNGDETFSKLITPIFNIEYPDTRYFSWIDFDNDHDLDLIINSGYVLANNTTIEYEEYGEFVEVMNVFEFPDPTSRRSGATKGIWADYNNDGYIDQFLIGAGLIYQNNGDGTFSPTDDTFPEYSRSGSWTDFDNDGDFDLILAYRNEKLILFENTNGSFSETILHGESQLLKFPVGIKSIDIDIDGDLDLIIPESDDDANGALKLFENTSGSGNHWIDLKLISSHPNHSTDGLTVRLITENGLQFQTSENTLGTGGKDHVFLHFGLGTNSFVTSIEIYWPSGTIQTLEIISTVDQLMEITEPFSTLPLPPANIQTSVLSHREIEITWEDSELESRYIIQRKKALDDEFVATYQMYKDSQSFTDTYLSPSTDFDYRIFAINSAGYSDTIYFNATTSDPPATPNAPTNLVLNQATYYDVQLSWDDNSDNETQFFIERSLDGVNYNLIDSVLANISNYTDSQIQPKSGYFYRISAENEGQISGYSNVLESQTTFIPFIELDLSTITYDESPKARFVQLDSNNMDLVLFGYREFSHISLDADTGTVVERVNLVNQNATSFLEIFDFDKSNRPNLLFNSYNPNINGRPIEIIKKQGSVWFDVLTSMNIENALYGSKFSDFDHDTFLDILNPSYNESITKTARDPADFKNISLNADKYAGSAAWINIDNDPLMEIMSVQRNKNDDTWGTILYDLDTLGGFLTNAGDFYSMGAWDVSAFDFDYDGDQDILILGEEQNVGQEDDGSFLFKNEGNGAFSLYQSFPTAHSAKWADMNNDGIHDLILEGIPIGWYEWGEFKIFYQSNSHSFEDSRILDFTNPSQGMVDLADYDYDGDVDMVISSFDETYHTYYSVNAYRNTWVEETGLPNTPPSIPGNLTHTISGLNVVLKWDKSTDDYTPQDGIAYNLILRTTDEIIISPLADLFTGRQLAPFQNNVGMSDNYLVRCLPDDDYEWAVQAIDAAGQASMFSAFQAFSKSGNLPATPTDVELIVRSDMEIEISWEVDTENVESQILERKMADGEFYEIANPLPGERSFIDINLRADTEYTYRIRTTNCAQKSAYSSEKTQRTFPSEFEKADWLDLGEAKGRFSLLGDYDNDGDLDLLLSYHLEYPDYIYSTKLFRFENGVFEDSGIELPYINEHSAASWIDYNQDGYLDLFFTLGEPFQSTTKLFENINGNDFIDAEINDIFELEELWQGGVSWADYDNDGDLDILAQGTLDFNEWVVRIYENISSGVFIESDVQNIEGIIKSRNPWADYDNDGDLDILINTEISTEDYRLAIYENNGDKSFTRIDLGSLLGLNRDLLNDTGDMVWGDYNSDGNIDILISGQDKGGNGSGITKIYKNTGNKSFEEVINTNMIREIYDVNTHWGDYDNDGDLDVFLYGDPFGAFNEQMRIYKNQGSDQFQLTNINYLIESIQHGSSAIGDINNDGALDICVLGQEDHSTPSVTFYKNNMVDGWAKTNSIPEPPTNLSIKQTVGTVTLKWTQGTDLETPANGLTYNAYVVNEEDSIIVNSYSMNNGYRKVVSIGNAQMNQFFILKNLKKGKYHWAVQSIDNSYQGSEFSEISTFELEEDLIPLQIEPIHENSNLLIFPNPFETFLTINAKSSQINKIEIFNLAGKLVKAFDSNNQSNQDLDLTELRSGVYILSIQTSIEKTKKILIKR